jgi:hypothetical protein
LQKLLNDSSIRDVDQHNKVNFDLQHAHKA